MFSEYGVPVMELSGAVHVSAPLSAMALGSAGSSGSGSDGAVERSDCVNFLGWRLRRCASCSSVWIGMVQAGEDLSLGNVSWYWWEESSICEYVLVNMMLGPASVIGNAPISAVSQWSGVSRTGVVPMVVCVGIGTTSPLP